MKTIFITVFEGVEAKNILRTGIVDALLKKSSGTRVVLFVKNKERADYYAREFSDPRITYEIVAPYDQVGIHKLFSSWKFLFLQTGTTDLRAKMVSEDRGAWYWYYSRVIHRMLAHRPFVALFRALDRLLSRNPVFDQYFRTYKPDLILLANLFEDFEVDFLKSAKRHGVKSIGLTNSWDRATARCILRVIPDKTIVFNDTLLDQMATHSHIPRSDFFVSGIPQYDDYFSPPSVTRDEFFKSIGIDPQKKLVVYSPIGGMFSNSDWDIMDHLHELHMAGKFGNDVEILVRFSPNDFIKDADLKKRPYLHYQNPGTRFSSVRSTDWDMNGRELEELRNTLHHMSLILCYASSISVDAAVVNKPVINIDFEIKDNGKLSKSPTVFYGMTHYAKALSYGGVRMARNTDELVTWVNKYLKDPTLDTEGRKKLAVAQCQFLDGKSVDRISTFIVSHL
jgi:hypothetical protein